MTIHLCDISRWQHPIDLAAVKAAGFHAVNVQLTGKAGYAFPEAERYLEHARTLKLGVSVYHWLDGRTSGAVQSDRVWRRIQAIGTQGLAVQVDCEDSEVPATWPIWRDFVTDIQQRLGRHVAAYTGGWWWQPRGWFGATLTPYLWAAPNRGYPGAYPGDSSPDWTAGYGGWPYLGVLQYAVTPVAGKRCTLSAIRDRDVWARLTGGAPLMLKGVDGEFHPQHEVAVDADRTPVDPELVAGAFKPDPWEEDPKRWEGSEPWQPGP